jgi:acetolactate synthase-1/2/3 large subunit
VLATPFQKKDGTPYSAHLADLARSFGCYAERVENPEELPRAFRRAFSDGRPAVIELLVSRELPWAGLAATGWWDVPVPAYLEARRTAYEKARSEEVLR